MRQSIPTRTRKDIIFLNIQVAGDFNGVTRVLRSLNINLAPCRSKYGFNPIRIQFLGFPGPTKRVYQDFYSLIPLRLPISLV
jgi:hypothetical protein